MINPWREQSKVNPQRKPNRQINNDVFHALIAAKLPGAVYQIVLVVIDRAWGYEKQEAAISLSYFQEATGLSRQSVGIGIQNAESMRLIVVERHGTNPRNPSHYMFNKHYDTWSTRQLNHTSKQNLLGNQITPDWSSKSSQTSQPLMPSVTMPKENSKENSKEKKTASFEEYKNQLRERFSDLDFDIELEKFNYYWSEGTRKLQRPKLALLNWMLRARKIKAQEAASGTHRQGSRRRSTDLIPRDRYHLPRESEADYQARMRRLDTPKITTDEDRRRGLA